MEDAIKQNYKENLRVLYKEPFNLLVPDRSSQSMAKQGNIQGHKILVQKFLCSNRQSKFPLNESAHDFYSPLFSCYYLLPAITLPFNPITNYKPKLRFQTSISDLS